MDHITINKMFPIVYLFPKILTITLPIRPQLRSVMLKIHTAMVYVISYLVINESYMYIPC